MKNKKFLKRLMLNLLRVSRTLSFVGLFIGLGANPSWGSIMTQGLRVYADADNPVGWTWRYGVDISTAHYMNNIKDYSQNPLNDLKYAEIQAHPDVGVHLEWSHHPYPWMWWGARFSLEGVRGPVAKKIDALNATISLYFNDFRSQAALVLGPTLKAPRAEWRPFIGYGSYHLSYAYRVQDIDSPPGNPRQFFIDLIDGHIDRTIRMSARGPILGIEASLYDVASVVHLHPRLYVMYVRGSYAQKIDNPNGAFPNFKSRSSGRIWGGEFLFEMAHQEGSAWYRSISIGPYFHLLRLNPEDIDPLGSYPIPNQKAQSIGIRIQGQY